MISIFAHTHARCAHKGAHKRTHSRSLNGKQTSLRICNIISDWIRPTQEKKAERWWAYTHTHLECEAMEAIFRAFFLLVLHFNSPHHAILNGNRFGNTIPKCDPPCVWRIPSIVLVLVRVFNVSNSTYKYAANASVLFILFYTNAK